MNESLKSKVEIVPAILPKSLEDISEHLAKVRGIARKVQIDVVDGHFAHNKTWPYRDHGTFDVIVSQEHGLPYWDEFDFEFDLMINNPKERVMDFVHAAASRIIIHASAPSAIDAMRLLADLKEEDYRDYSVKIGVALLPNEQPEVLIALETLFDFVQVMGIERVGFQGEPFDARAIYLVERLRNRYPDLSLQVDGAVSKDNAQALANAGASRLVVGHDIWDAPDPKKEIEELTRIANS